jgi:prepilin-type N-terminal cleavage/methylation domain-containing protein
MSGRRGFTLVEMMVSVTLMSIVFGALGALYLEFRIDATSQESRVIMTRRASLALESIARDIVAADAVEQASDSVHVRRGDEVVTWRIDEEGLARVAAGRRRAVAPRAVALEVTEEKAGHRARLVMRRRLIKHREVRIVREVFIGRRK